MTAIRFEPWVPEAPDPRLRGVRLLLLGESHYEEGDEDEWSAAQMRELTRFVVRRWGVAPEGRTLFFANVYTLLTGRPWTLGADDHTELWNSISFYNYVQRLVPGGARHRPDKSMWGDSREAFDEVLEAVRPQAVLVLGEELWQNMRDGELLREEPEALGKVYGFALADGTMVQAAHVYHPSSLRLKPAEDHLRVMRFLESVRR